MLEQEGLAVTTPRKGAEVAKMTLKDMEDVLEIRDALDELAVRIACQKISDEQLKQLEDMKELFEKSTQTGNVKKIAEADVTFHDVIYEATGNPKLVTLFKQSAGAGLSLPRRVYQRSKELSDIDCGT